MWFLVYHENIKVFKASVCGAEANEPIYRYSMKIQYLFIFY